MEYRFNAAEWDKLAPSDRIRRCRLWAEESQKLASQTSGTIHEAYLAIAMDWQELANEIERSMEHPSGR